MQHTSKRDKINRHVLSRALNKKKVLHDGKIRQENHPLAQKEVLPLKKAANPKPKPRPKPKLKPKAKPKVNPPKEPPKVNAIIPDAVIIAENKLAGPDDILLTGPPLDDKLLPWPAEIKATFVISLREQRWAGMLKRLGPWEKNVVRWEATNGLLIDPRAWIANGKLKPHSNLTRGEIGCHDSHVRIWEHIVAQQIPVTFILEDDANIRHILEHADKMALAFNEVASLTVPWHVLYLGRNHVADNKRIISPHLTEPKGCQGLFAYVVSLAGARLLLQYTRPIQSAVDILMSNLHDANKIYAVALASRICYVVPVHSDTVHIR